MQQCYLCQHLAKIFLTVRGYTILRCTHCGLTYTEKRVRYKGTTEENSDKFVQEYFAETSRYNEYFDSVIDRIERYNTKPRLVLDVGCGVGLFLERVKVKGWNGLGVDMSSAAIKKARSKGLRVRLGKIEDVHLLANSFDVITLFQTIEHFEDPLSTLQKLYSLLRKNGILLLTTPSEESFMAKLMGKFWFGYRNIEHLYFFNPRSLFFLQQKAGFSKVIIQTENSRLLSLSWVFTRVFDYYYNQNLFLSRLIAKTRPYWNYLRWITFREPRVNLISVAIK